MKAGDLPPVGIAALLALLAAGPVAGDTPRADGAPALRPDSPRPGGNLERLRALYLTAVAEEGAIDHGLAEITELRAHLRPAAGSWLDEALMAYGGALTTLRAKHAHWPPARLRHLRDGLATLDGVVTRHPGHVEARYLRLMSCYYLPAVLGRSDSVREDFAALARLLPGVRGSYPRELYASMIRFVLQQGRLSEDARAPLEAVLPLADE